LQAIATAVRVQERKHTLTGANAPLRTDPIQSALEAGPSETSTENLRRVFEEWRAEVAEKAEGEGAARSGGGAGE
jgi:hypothetical protein